MSERVWTKRDVQATCTGAVHTIPVPRWMSPEEAWETMCREGRLPVPDPECAWAVIECPGGDDCPCLGGELSDTYQWLHGDVLVYDHASTLAADT